LPSCSGGVGQTADQEPDRGRAQPDREITVFVSKGSVRYLAFAWSGREVRGICFRAADCSRSRSLRQLGCARMWFVSTGGDG